MENTVPSVLQLLFISYFYLFPFAKKKLRYIEYITFRTVAKVSIINLAIFPSKSQQKKISTVFSNKHVLPHSIKMNILVLQFLGMCQDIITFRLFNVFQIFVV